MTLEQFVAKWSKIQPFDQVEIGELNDIHIRLDSAMLDVCGCSRTFIDEGILERAAA